MRARRRLVPGLLMTTLMAGLTLAAPRADAAEPDPWKFSITPYLWTLSMNGDVTLGPRTGNVDLPFSDLFDHLNVALMGEGEASKGPWTLYVNGLYAQLEDDGASATDSRFVSTTLQATIKMNYSIVETGVMYRLGAWPLGHSGAQGSAPSRTWTLDAYAGARYTDIDVETHLDAGFQTPVGASSASVQWNGGEDWIDPIIGLRAFLHPADKWTVAIKGDIGGFGVGSEFTWSAFGGVMYDFNRYVGLVVGYKALYQNYETGSGTSRFVWDMLSYGPGLGVNFRFE